MPGNYNVPGVAQFAALDSSSRFRLDAGLLTGVTKNALVRSPARNWDCLVIGFGELTKLSLDFPNGRFHTVVGIG